MGIWGMWGMWSCLCGRLSPWSTGFSSGPAAWHLCHPVLKDWQWLYVQSLRAAHFEEVCFLGNIVVGQGRQKYDRAGRSAIVRNNNVLRAVSYKYIFWSTESRAGRRTNGVEEKRCPATLDNLSFNSLQWDYVGPHPHLQHPDRRESNSLKSHSSCRWKWSWELKTSSCR